MKSKLPLAYVVAAYAKPEVQTAISRGEYPKAEYNIFVERNPTEPLDYGCLEAARSPLARYYLKKEVRHWSLAAHALSKRNGYSGFLATGEDVGIPMAILALVLRVKQPVHIVTHGSYFGSGKFARIIRILGSNRHLHFLCLSETLRSALVNEFGVRASQAHNTSYGVDTGFFRPVPWVTGGRPVIASAGTASRDYQTLAKAVSGLDADVQIAADSAWFREPVNVGEEETPSNVTIRSCGDYVGLRDLYARASFVVVPLCEARRACGYAVIAEAMAMGKAVITTRVSSASDFIVDGETGMYVKLGDAADLRLKIDTLLCNPALAIEMGRRARTRIEREFSLEAYCKGMEDVVRLTAR